MTNFNYQPNTTTIEELAHQAFQQQFSDKALAYQKYAVQIRVRTNRLIQCYNNQKKIIDRAKQIGIVEQVVAKKNFVKTFFKEFTELQNLFNKINNQKILITYVHEDETSGRREIRIADNTIDHLRTSVGVQKFTNRNFVKTEYMLDSHYKLLKNSLSDDDNKTLQEIATEVTNRTQRDRKHRIFWEYKDQWYGYRVFNRGPINEAFASFYIENFRLQGTLNEKIHTFMMSQPPGPQGVIYADNANGFLVGDLSKGGLQFAVKGRGGGMQGYKKVIEQLIILQSKDFSYGAYQDFIHTLTEVERNKATPLVKEMSTRSLQQSVSYFLRNTKNQLEKAIK